jgi:uncharacterized protein YegP (UPF0339 family)
MARFELYRDSQNQWRWRFVASNGRTIADSGEGYHNKQDCLDGITLVKTDAPGAPVEES